MDEAAVEHAQAHASAGASMVSLREASKVYSRKYRALRRVSLDVARGEILAVFGGVGAGKSSLLKLINRLTEASSGEVVVDGRPTGRWDPIDLRRGIGYVVAGGGLLPHLGALENAAVVPRLQGRSRDECRHVAAQHLEMVGFDLRRLGARRPAELEPAQRVRVGLARALAGGGEILLLDEPLAGLDSANRRLLQDELPSLLRRLNKTVLWATSELDEACRVADRIAQLDSGQLVRLGRSAEFGAIAAGPAPASDALEPEPQMHEPAPGLESRA